MNVRFLPQRIRADIRQAWGDGSPAGIHHAAKQAACFLLDVTGIEKTDQNAVVDWCLKTGMIAQACNNADAFIKEFESTMLSDGTWWQ